MLVFDWWFFYFDRWHVEIIPTSNFSPELLQNLQWFWCWILIDDFLFWLLTRGDSIVPGYKYFSMILIFSQVSLILIVDLKNKVLNTNLVEFLPLSADFPELPMFSPSCDQQSWVSLFYVLTKSQKDVMLKRRKVEKTKRQKVDWW